MKSRIRIIVCLLALAFSMSSASVSTQARDGMPPTKKKPRRTSRRSSGSTTVAVMTTPPAPLVPAPDAPAVKRQGGNIIVRGAKAVGRGIKAGADYVKGKIASGEGAKSASRLKRYEGEDYGKNY